MEHLSAFLRKSSTLITVFAMAQALCTDVLAQSAWRGSQDTLGAIYRRGPVSIGTANQIPSGVDLLMRGESNRPATIRMEHRDWNNFAWNIFPAENALKFFYSHENGTPQYKASLNSEGILSVNQFETNEWIGQGHRENFLHFQSNTGALGHFTTRPEFFFHQNYPAQHPTLQLGIFLNKNANDRGSDLPKIAFGGSDRAVFSFHQENGGTVAGTKTFGFYSQFANQRATGTRLQLFGASTGSEESFVIDRSRDWTELNNLSSSSNWMGLQTLGGRVGVGQFGTGSTGQLRTPEAAVHILQPKGSLLIESEVLGPSSHPELQFKGSPFADFTVGRGAIPQSDAAFRFYNGSAGATTGNAEVRIMGYSPGTNLAESQKIYLSLGHDGLAGTINSNAGALSLQKNGSPITVGSVTNPYANTGRTMTVMGTFQATHTVYTAGFQMTSDRRLKTDIKRLESASQLLSQISGYRYAYDRSQDEMLPAGYRMGLMAQEVQAIMPEAIDTAANGRLSVDYTMLIPVLVEANRELRTSLDSLKAEIASIKAAMHQNIANPQPLEAATPIAKDGLELAQNLPNPTRGITSIRYTLPQGVQVAQLTVFDLSGRRVLQTELKGTGTQNFTLNLTGQQTGVYIYTLSASGYMPVSKSLILE